MTVRSLTGAAALLVGVLVFAAGTAGAQPIQPAQAPAAGTSFVPPPDSAIPDDPFGREVALGRKLFTDTSAAAPQFVGNDLKCSNCHLDAGRRPNSAPLWASYVLFPQYRAKNDHVNTFEERLQGCFEFSMNGKAPPLGDPVLVALESYTVFLSKGAPMGAKLPGGGYPRLEPPPLEPDRSRGQQVYLSQCAMCHGEDGSGQKAGGTTVFPPLWGERSFNWGAGMSDIDKAARFIKANMPFSQGGKLTDQQAWDVAAYMDGKPRPQDPRYTGSVAQTRARFHDTAQSLYGTTVDGVLLGGDGPPKPFAGDMSGVGGTRDELASAD
jgi:thiosulfate dehydrogenase